jgi:hypothetical protein
MADERPNVHLLDNSSFLPDMNPCRTDLVQVARLLVPPGLDTVEALRKVSLSVVNRGEGYLVPVVGPSGAGKTTLGNNVSTFLPGEFTPTVVHTGEVTFEALTSTVVGAMSGLATNDTRPMPLNIDHRESAPPSAEELAAIKRFAREPSGGYRCAVLWPETSDDIGSQIREGI